MKTNPNGSNQFRTDPRQKLCWSLYTNPNSKTFGNAKQSAINAGYSEKSAGLVTVTEWFISKYKNVERITKSEKVLDDILEMPTEILKLKGESSVTLTDPALIRIKQDTAKFYLERIARRKYTTRQELTGSGGKELIPSQEAMDKASKAINDFIDSNK